MSDPAKSPDMYDINPAPIDPVSLADVTFSPDGIDRVASYLRQDPFLHNAPRHVMAMTMAYFASGAYNDGQHDIARKRFHPTFRTFRHGYQEKDKAIYAAARDEFTRVVFDFLTTWDRLNEGATYAVHTNATRRPNTPACAEEGIFDVYALPRMVATSPEVGFALTRMVQDFAENVAPDAMRRWDKLNHKDLWGEKGNPPRPHTPPAVLIPLSDTTHYSFHGHAPGTLEPLIDAYRTSLPTAVWSLHSLPPPPVQTTPRRGVTLQATQASSSSRGRVFVPPSSPARRIQTRPSTSSGPPVDTITETDWNEGIKAHPRETYKYTDKILALQQKLSEQGSYLAVLDLEVKRLCNENTRLFIENARLRMDLPTVVMPPPKSEQVMVWSRLTSASVSQALTHPQGVPVARSTSTASEGGTFGPIAASQATSVASRAPSAAPRASSVARCMPIVTLRPPSTAPRRSSTASPTPSAMSRPAMHSPRPERTYRPVLPASTHTNATYESGIEFEIVSPPNKIEVFGEATAHVLDTHNINARYHQALWIIYMEVEQKKWRKSVRRLLDISDKDLANTIA